MRGQGLVEYALILILIAVVVIVILALLGPAVGNIFANITGNVCMDSGSVDCKIAKVEDCKARDLYTEDQCIDLIGGGGRP